MYKKVGSIQFQGANRDMFVTDEYDRFKFMKANRAPELASGLTMHATAIMESLKESYQFTLITCNEKMEVIDGQHRVAAMREAKLPVYFICIPGYAGKEIHRYNTTSETWKAYDFARYYSVLGKKPYVELLRLHDVYPVFKIGTLATLLMESSDGRKKSVFNKGNFKINVNVPHMELYFKQVLEMQTYVNFATQRGFTEAAIRLFKHPKYDHKAFMSSLQRYSHLITPANSSAEYMIQFSEVYNFNRPSKFRLDFHSAKDLELAHKARTVLSRGKKMVAA